MNFPRLFSAARQRCSAALVHSLSRTPPRAPTPRVARPMRLARGRETRGWGRGGVGGMPHRHRHQLPPPGYVRGDPFPTWPPRTGWLAAIGVLQTLLTLASRYYPATTTPSRGPRNVICFFFLHAKFEWTVLGTAFSIFTTVFRM